MPVSIVGGRSSGKSVFVALLINSAINYSVSKKNYFRVYRDPATCTVTGEMLSSLKNSLWPPATIKGSLLEYSFSFGYSNVLTRALLGLKEGVGKQVGKIVEKQVSRGELFNTVTFKLIDIAGEDVEMLSRFLEESKSSGVPFSDDVAPSLQKALGSDVIVFLIDSEKITADRNDPRYKEMLAYDIIMSTLISYVSQHRTSYEKEAKPLYPVFILTKFDAIDPIIRKGQGLQDNYVQWIEKLSDDRSIRKKFFNSFMNTFFRGTLSSIFGSSLVGTELEDAPIFISYTQTELNEDGILVPKVVKRGQANEILYSESEYTSFISYFGKIANKISDKKNPEGESQAAVGVG